ncbi:unnamed protein product [Bursaphelenchus xylophilus]|uniref:(pine wood nematode) hypothetical protein n=1 Tax=Bursaphelenchus xylophilus TaxID=6326 RepID=A0A1I7SAM3_BURXY|nr:unnamed protein product [Bursaphelenchus xylophilus]CAG9079178.1 unnamed protein product [Bursaphelenchus xylophilus]
MVGRSSTLLIFIVTVIYARSFAEENQADPSPPQPPTDSPQQLLSRQTPARRPGGGLGPDDGHQAGEPQGFREGEHHEQPEREPASTPTKEPEVSITIEKSAANMVGIIPFVVLVAAFLVQ